MDLGPTGEVRLIRLAGADTLNETPIRLRGGFFLKVFSLQEFSLIGLGILREWFDRGGVGAFVRDADSWAGTVHGVGDHGLHLEAWWS